MLDIRFIRENKEFVKERLAIKNFKELNLINEVISLDDEIKSTKRKLEEAQMQVNSFSTEIPKLIKEGKQDEVTTIKDKVTLLKVIISDSKSDFEKKEKIFIEQLLKLPNLPSAKVPAGKTPEDNVVVREGGNKPTLHANATPHWDLAKKYNLID